MGGYAISAFAFPPKVILQEKHCPIPKRRLLTQIIHPARIPCHSHVHDMVMFRYIDFENVWCLLQHISLHDLLLLEIIFLRKQKDLS